MCTGQGVKQLNPLKKGLGYSGNHFVACFRPHRRSDFHNPSNSIESETLEMIYNFVLEKLFGLLESRVEFFLLGDVFSHWLSQS